MAATTAPYERVPIWDEESAIQPRPLSKTKGQTYMIFGEYPLSVYEYGLLIVLTVGILIAIFFVSFLVGVAMADFISPRLELVTSDAVMGLADQNVNMSSAIDDLKEMFKEYILKEPAVAREA